MPFSEIPRHERPTSRDATTAQRRFTAGLLSGFAALALLLPTLGIYGVRAALAMTRLLSSQLLEVSTTDPMSTLREE